MTWRCAAIEWFDSIKGGVLKMGVLKRGVLMRWPFRLHAMFFCKIFTKTHEWDYMAMSCYRMVWTEHGIPDFISLMRALNPVFWPKGGIKNRGFHALGLMLCSFVKSLQDGFPKTHACDDCFVQNVLWPAVCNSPRFGKTRIFTNSLKFGTTNCETWKRCLRVIVDSISH